LNLLGIDYGKRRIGFAVGIKEAGTILPLTLTAAPDWHKLLGIVRELVMEYDVGKIILGWPVNMDGSPGILCAEIDILRQRLAAALDLPVELADERLSSFEARERLVGAGVASRKQKSAKDGLAAALILESYWEQ